MRATQSGGETTVPDASRNAFALPARNQPSADRSKFAVGNSFFNQNWVIAPASTSGRDGLGPLFNARSCSACHFKDGRGRPPEPGDPFVSLLFRFSQYPDLEARTAQPDPHYGFQLQVDAIPDVQAEGTPVLRYEPVHGHYADGTPYELQRPIYEFTNLAYGPLDKETLIGPRVAPAVYGLGLLEAVPLETLKQLADPDDLNQDGISGRIHWITLPSDSHAGEVGRFGWKANQPTIASQTASAFVNDIGITTPDRPDHPFSSAQAALKEVPDGGKPEMSGRIFSRVVFYMQTLAVPERRNADDPVVLAGARTFQQVGCTQCHTPQLKTGSDHPVPYLNNQVIHPYTDLLLHDMGPDLADNRPDLNATGSEWRTPPLWGIGLVSVVNGHTRFLHDGRARSLEEAILWHGGEAETARNQFKALPTAQREALIKFLESL